jgi:hypothetical protein
LIEAVESRRSFRVMPWLLLVGLSTALCGLAACRSAGHPFFGEWRLMSFSSPGVSALSPVEATTWIGTIASYEKNRAAFGKSTCPRPTYTIRLLSPEEFLQEYRVRASDLGLTGTPLTLVTVGCATNWSNRGSFLILKSPDTMLTTWDGVFFELERRTP